MKRRDVLATVIGLAVIAALAVFLRSRGPEYTKYTDTFFDTFDTSVTVVAYTRTEDEFDRYFDEIHARFLELHRLYDIYNSYDGVNNARTINQNAGIAPVVVDKDLVDLVKASKQWFEDAGGGVNIAMGAVLSIWHDYRERGLADPETAEIPPMDLLAQAALHTDINKIVIDEDKSAIYLEDPKMSLDLGAVAKGFATEVVAKEMEAEGLVSAVISSGGNVRTIGKPLDGVRERWGIGIQDPVAPVFSDEEHLLDVVFVNDASVVSSGDYQRYYVVDGKTFHHIIDPKTLLPADHFRAVTVVTPDSGFADFMSTTLFILPLEEGKALAMRVGVDSIWVEPDGTVYMTDGFKTIAKNQGASGAKP